MFYGNASAEPINIISDRIYDDVPPKMSHNGNFEYGYPFFNVFLALTRQKHGILSQT